MPIALIALWYAGYKKQTPLLWLLLFPSALAMFLFSPELGPLMGGAAVVFIALAAWAAEPGARKGALAWSGAGLAITAIIFAGLYLLTSWMPNYLVRLAEVNRNYNWSYGMSKPGLNDFFTRNSTFYYYLPPFVCLAAAIFAARDRLRKGRKENGPVWIVTPRRVRRRALAVAAFARRLPVPLPSGRHPPEPGLRAAAQTAPGVPARGADPRGPVAGARHQGFPAGHSRAGPDRQDGSARDHLASGLR